MMTSNKHSTVGLRLEYLFRKGLTWTIEQPSSSLLPLYKPLEDTTVGDIYDLFGETKSVRPQLKFMTESSFMF